MPVRCAGDTHPTSALNELAAGSDVLIQQIMGPLPAFDTLSFESQYLLNVCTHPRPAQCTPPAATQHGCPCCCWHACLDMLPFLASTRETCAFCLEIMRMLLAQQATLLACGVRSASTLYVCGADVILQFMCEEVSIPSFLHDCLICGVDPVVGVSVAALKTF